MKVKAERRNMRLEVVHVTIACTPDELTTLRNNLGTVLEKSPYAVGSLTWALFHALRDANDMRPAKVA